MREQRLGHGISVQGFDSLEEILAYQAEQEQIASEAALPEQWEIGWGAYAFRRVEDLSIWGHIFTEAEVLGENPDEEAYAELEALQDAHERGYRYGKWYSAVEPTGEYGSAHVVTLWEITQQDFERARLVGWEVWAELAAQLSEQIMTARARQNATMRGQKDD